MVLTSLETTEWLCGFAKQEGSFIAAMLRYYEEATRYMCTLSESVRSLRQHGGSSRLKKTGDFKAPEKLHDISGNKAFLNISFNQAQELYG